MPLQLSCNSRCFPHRTVLFHSNIHMKLLKTEELRPMVYKSSFFQVFGSRGHIPLHAFSSVFLLVCFKQRRFWKRRTLPRFSPGYKTSENHIWSLKKKNKPKLEGLKGRDSACNIILPLRKEK